MAWAFDNNSSYGKGSGGGGGWGSLFSKGAEMFTGGASKAFDWIEEHEATADLLSGVAAGAAQGYMTQKQIDSQEEQAELDREHQMKLQKQQQQAATDANRITPVSTGNYGSYKGLISGGMISDGNIAGGKDETTDDETTSRSVRSGRRF